MPKTQQDSSTLPGESPKTPNLLCQHLKPNHNLHGVGNTGLAAHRPSGADAVEKEEVTCERPVDFLTVRITHTLVRKEHRRKSLPLFSESKRAECVEYAHRMSDRARLEVSSGWEC